MKSRHSTVPTKQGWKEKSLQHRSYRAEERSSSRADTVDNRTMEEILRLQLTPEDEDEEGRERRIRRLKRRQRSAGLDSEEEDADRHIHSSSRQAREHEKASAWRAQSQDLSDEERRHNDIRLHDRRVKNFETKHRRSPGERDRRWEAHYDSTDRFDAKSQRKEERGSAKSNSESHRWRKSSDWPRRERKWQDDEKNGHSSGKWQDSNTLSWQDEADERTTEREKKRKWGREGKGDSAPSKEEQPSYRDRSESPGARILRRRRESQTSNSKADEYSTMYESDRTKVDRSHDDTTARMKTNDDQEENKALANGILLTSEVHRKMIRGRPDEIYEQVAQVGEGTYGQVFKAQSDKTGVVVALKKIRMEGEKDGFPITAMREIKLLQGLRHENIVLLHEIMLSKHSVYMVFEYLQHDLNGILAQSSITFEPAHLKSLAAQLLSGLAYLHQHSILHRDLKGSNLLLNNEGTLKLADFGLARTYTKHTRSSRKRSLDYTNRVVTLWYRAPELLFGETSYGDSIDIWGAGCIFLELFLRKPILPGNDEIHQVQLLYEVLGPVSKSDWPEVESLPWFELIRPTVQDEAQLHAPSQLHTLSSNKVPTDAIEVAQALLTYNPSKRLSAIDALQLPYFTSNEPSPRKPADILQLVEGEWHEFESRKAKRDAAAQALHEHVHRDRHEKQQSEAQEIRTGKGSPGASA